MLVSLIALALKSLFSNDGGIGGWWRRAALCLPPSSRTRGCLRRRLDLGEGCPVGWSRLRVRQNADHEILQEENLEKLSTLSLPHTWHVYTRYIPCIYLLNVYDRDITSINLEYYRYIPITFQKKYFSGANWVCWPSLSGRHNAWKE